jgi:hypothetical protein
MNRDAAILRKLISAACLTCLQTAWGIEDLTAPSDSELRARWVEAIRSVEPLWKAITECLDKNKGIVANNCDSLGALQGKNSASLNFWPEHTLPTFHKYSGAATTLVPGTGQISISSFGPALGHCAVVLTPNIVKSNTPMLNGTAGTVSWTVSQVDTPNCAAVVVGVGKRTMAWVPSGTAPQDHSSAP